MNRKIDDLPAFPAGYVGDTNCSGLTVAQMGIFIAMHALVVSGKYDLLNEKSRSDLGDTAINIYDATMKAMRKNKRT